MSHAAADHLSIARDLPKQYSVTVMCNNLRDPCRDQQRLVRMSGACGMTGIRPRGMLLPIILATPEKGIKSMHEIDRLLHQATETGAVPGVVAMAADAAGPNL